MKTQPQTCASEVMQKVYEQIKDMADDLVKPAKWPCFYQTKERPCCIIIHGHSPELIEEMCPTCQLLARVQEIERATMKTVRVQQMWEAGRA